MNGVRMASFFSPLLNLETLASIHTQSVVSSLLIGYVSLR